MLNFDEIFFKEKVIYYGLKNKPVAMQNFIIKKEPRWVCFDYINSWYL